MRPIVPFVHGLNSVEGDQWLTALLAAQPEFDIVQSKQVTPAQASQVQVAIVANPDPAHLAKLPNLKWVHSLWAGVEKLMSALPDPNVRVARLIDNCLTDTMSEAVLAWTLYLHRDMPLYAAQQAKGIWHQWPVRTPSERTIGVLGLGELGSAAATRLAANGFEVLGWSRSPKQIDGLTTFCGDDGLRHVLRNADIIVLLLPLTPDTRGLIGSQALSLMKKGSSLINFARGTIVETEALNAALDSGLLNHAVLDVFTVEPLPADNQLWTNPRVTILPHISAPTNKSSASAHVVGSITRWFAGGSAPIFVDVAQGY